MANITTGPQPVPEGTPQTPVPPAPIPQSAIDRAPAAVPTPYQTGVTVSGVTASSTPVPSLANTKYLMLGAAVTTDTSGTQTVTNNGTVTQSATKPF